MSKGSAANPVFHPLTPWVRGSLLTQARHRLELRGDTGTVQVSAAYQTANNVDTPSGPMQLGSQSYLDQDGVQYGNDWVDLTSALDGGSWIRFGTLVKQDSDGGLQGGTVLLRVDLKNV
jgi:hypothetical protein